MIKTIFTSLIFLLLSVAAFAQIGVSLERTALRNLEKKEWEKTHQQTRKALRKDSVSAGAKFILARYFFKKDNPAFHIDSAYRYTETSLIDFIKSTPKERDRLKRIPVDSGMLIALREKIDSAAFERSKALNTEAAYNHFLLNFTSAKQKDDAIKLRDEVAFLAAVQENSYEAFLNFLNKYPEAKWADDARNKYDYLLYEAKTQEKRLSSFQKFHSEHPLSPYRKDAEKNIFLLSTRTGKPEDFFSFLKTYPESVYAKKAADILFHLWNEKDEPQWPEGFLTDSLKHVIQLQKSYLVPVLAEGKFGFIDKDGNNIIQPSLESIPEEYKCGDLEEDVLAVPGKLLARNGKVIYEGTLEEFDDLGFGFLLIKIAGKAAVIHKSGYSVIENIDDAEVLNGKFLITLNHDQWKLFTLTGIPVIEETFDTITAHGNILIFKKKSKYLVATQTLIVDPDFELQTNHYYDHVEGWLQNRLWVRTNNMEALLDESLNIVIEFDDHELTPTFFGATGKSSGREFIFNRTGEKSESFQDLALHQPWIAVKQNDHWKLFDAQKMQAESQAYDSLKYRGPFPVGFYKDTVAVHFSKTIVRKFTGIQNATFVPGKDSTSFLMLERNEKKTLYDFKGDSLFTVVFDDIQYAGNDLFIVAKQNKKGLMNRKGELLLQVEYDAIGSVVNNVISVLKKMKFGIYDVTNNILIKPQYDKNLNAYSTGIITAYQKGKSGFIDWKGKPIGKFEFDEIQHWNDTAALVKKNGSWQVYNIRTHTIAEDHIKNISMIREDDEEKVAIVQRGKSYGVLSNKKGTIIPITFSDLVNLGSKYEPLYFTEKHVSEASLFVVIYYDRHGKMLSRHVYEDDDYDRIYCSDN